MAQTLHEELTTGVSSPLTPSAPRSGDHERLFSLLEGEGPAPDEFMLFLSDPMFERENVFEDEDEA